MYVYMHGCMHGSVNVCTHVNVCIHVCVCMYMLYVRIYRVYVYVCIFSPYIFNEF